MQPDTNLTGIFYYDLADITGLKGLKDVRLQFGISTHEENRAPGETVAVSEISIVPQGKVDSRG